MKRKSPIADPSFGDNKKSPQSYATARFVVSPIWALVFSHLHDFERIVVLPLVSKQFEQVCRYSESWSSTRIAKDTLSYRLIFKHGVTSINFKEIGFLDISDALLSENRTCNLIEKQKRSSDSQIDANFLWQPKVISISLTSKITQDISRFLYGYASNLSKLRLENTYSKQNLIEILSKPFAKLLSLSWKQSICERNHALLEDCDLVAIQTGCPSLTGLHLHGPLDKITRKGFDSLTNCPNLKTLTITPTGEFRFSQLIVQLQTLNFAERRNLDLLSFNWPPSRLNTLYLDESQAFLDDFRHYSTLQLPETKELKIKQNLRIQPEEITHLLKRNKTLEVLHLCLYCPLLEKLTFDCINNGNLSELICFFSSVSHLCELIVNIRDGLHWSRFLRVVVEKKKKNRQITKFIFRKEKELNSATQENSKTEMPEVLRGLWNVSKWRLLKAFSYLPRESIENFLVI